MEAFFAHNPGIPSRIPHQIQFQDYGDDELLQILHHVIEERYRGTMKVEGGMGGLYLRIVARRIGCGRGKDGFGNARAVHNKFAQIADRQSTRLQRERRAGSGPDDKLLTKEDLLGPDPCAALKGNAAWSKLQSPIGIKTVKESVQVLFDSIQHNYHRELEEKPLVQYSLNRVFLGSPGTGKTSVAKLYGRTLADIGLLSNGEVVIKNPSDFVGSVLGGSESNTKAILAATVGKVLIIDEAYMLSGGSRANGPAVDTYKSAVIDTIVAEVQSTAGEDRCVLLLGYKDEMEHMFQSVNPGLTRRFPLDSAFVFEDFTDTELKKILELKLDQQGFEATDHAKNVAMDMLRRARNRPHFGNAGEVDILLDKAKALHQKRMSAGKSKNSNKLEAQDFDENFNRGERAATNCRKLFEGVVGCEKTVKQLEGYQTTAVNMKALDMDPREQIPFNFLFRGPPGTGKTTTARRMGKVYYDMGFLATAEVVVCSATDLIGEYVGKTGPKTQKVLERALGKVLFIDEAYRLAEGPFAIEAMDEIVDCLTKPKFAQKLVTILAGYDADINRLMSINPGLSSRFPEAMIFDYLAPADCLRLFVNLLKNKKHLDISILDPPTEHLRERLLKYFAELSELPSWGNARDIQSLAKTVWGTIILTATPPVKTLLLTTEVVLESIESMISERSHRTQSAQSTRHSPPSLALSLPTETASLKPPEPQTTIHTATRISQTPPEPAQAPPPVQPKAETRAQPSADPRDVDVTDAIWHRLSQDKQAAASLAREHDKLCSEGLALQEAAALEVLNTEDELAALKAAAEAAVADDEGKRRHEAMRLKRNLERMAREAKLAEIERKMREMEEERKEVKAQQKLRNMGGCCAGFRWIKQAQGYRCAGGSHFVGNAALGM